MTKVSRPDPTIANELRDRVLARFPELATNPIPGVWFTGSNIWTALLGEPAPVETDWDIMLVDCVENTPFESGEELVKRLGLLQYPSISTATKHRPDGGKAYGDDEEWGAGMCYRTPAGEVDVWHVEDDVLGGLRRYPTQSHSHCRAAFSLTDGIVALPNELADDTLSTFEDRANRNHDEDLALELYTRPTYGVDRSGWIQAIAFGVLCVLLAMTIGMCVGGCAVDCAVGCATARAAGPTMSVGRTIEQQAANAVDVERTCVIVDPVRQVMETETIVASGAVLRDDVVLTANHVIRCKNGALGAVRVLVAGDPLPASVSWRDPTHDLALVAARGVRTGRPATLAPVGDVGERVCVESAQPHRTRSCGGVVAKVPRSLDNGSIDTETHAGIVPGNSGSAVYDARGFVVGVATNAIVCGDVLKYTCGGLVSSVFGRVP